MRRERTLPTRIQRLQAVAAQTVAGQARQPDGGLRGFDEQKAQKPIVSDVRKHQWDALQAAACLPPVPAPCILAPHAASHAAPTQPPHSPPCGSPGGTLCFQRKIVKTEHQKTVKPLTLGSPGGTPWAAWAPPRPQRRGRSPAPGPLPAPSRPRPPPAPPPAPAPAPAPGPAAAAAAAAAAPCPRPGPAAEAAPAQGCTCGTRGWGWVLRVSGLQG